MINIIARFGRSLNADTRYKHHCAYHQLRLDVRTLKPNWALAVRESGNSKMCRGNILLTAVTKNLPIFTSAIFWLYTDSHVRIRSAEGCKFRLPEHSAYLNYTPLN